MTGPPRAGEGTSGEGTSRRNSARTARRRYDRIAPVYDAFEALMERARYRHWRDEAWAEVRERRILEVGVGTGRNFPHHPAGIELAGIDLSPEMLRRARARIDESPVRPALVLMDAQDLAFSDGAFDGAVATFVFCSVPDPVRGLREVRRVLRSGGRLVLLEHVRSPNPALGRAMHWLNPVMVRITGANIDRDTVGNVERAGFRVERVKDLGAGGIFKLIVAFTP